MDRLRIAALLALTLGLTARATHAQTPEPDRQVIDRVVAVVGDSAILQTDLDEGVFRILASTGQTQLPDDPAERERLYREALDARINELLILIAAERDSVTVEDADVERQVDAQIAQQRRAFGGDAAFEEALRVQGFTLAGYRHELMRQVRNQGVFQRYIAKARGSRGTPPITDDQIREFFEANRDRIGDRPETLTFELIILPTRASDSARAAARAEAEEILQRIREGEDFAQLARRHSQDPGSRDRGGDLGWFREGVMVPAFNDAVFSMPPGAVSGIVESSFGFHIIKLEKIKGAERQARHILIIPETTAADVERTRATAAEVMEKMRAGVPIDSLVKTYGDPADKNQGRIGPVVRDQLPPSIAEVLADAEAGDLVGPFMPEYRDNRWAVIKVSDVTEQGEYTLDDPLLRTRIRQELEYQFLLEEIFKELRDRTYIDIRL